ncbi:MAG: peptidase C2 [Candidatus Eremiobacteraeota bacterium]|nr:peptidase C2 [Candidatus Eremiobacteraeota bacterium]
MPADYRFPLTSKGTPVSGSIWSWAYGQLSAVSPGGSAAATLPAAVVPAPPSSPPASGSAVSWTQSLKDPALKADFSSFSGAITEAEVTKALEDLAGELTASKTMLTSSQLGDLKTIAANIGSTGASAYLQFIVNAFANGDAANATWTGGAANAIPLGTLAAVETVTKLDELIGKWFLGTDLPSSTVAMEGYSPFSITYSTVTKPLYAAGGPSANDVNQGYLGDCYFLSALAEVASQDPAAIESMITNNGDGTYGVRFFVNGQACYVTVNAELADGGKIFNSGPDLWASLVEEAYAEAQTQGVSTGNLSGANSFSDIGSGGEPAYTLEEITSATAITEFAPGSSATWTRLSLNSSLSLTNWTLGQSSASTLSTLAADLAAGDDLVLSSYTNARDSAGRTTLVADHAMSIMGYDAATGDLVIRNPWGTEPGQTWDTTFEVSLKTLLADGDWITADNAGTATSVSGASVVAASGLQAMAQIQSFTVADSAADVAAGVSGPIGDSKLKSLTVTGAAGADTLSLAGLGCATTINMGGNSDAATVSNFASTGAGAGQAAGLSLGAGYALTLGSGAATIDFALGASGGVEDVAGFNAARDMLSVALNGASLEQTLVNGGDWISSSADLGHGVFLAGVGSVQKVSVSGGIATVV